MHGEIETVIGLVQNLAMGYSPKAQHVATYSPFMKLVLKGLSDFYTIDVTAPPAKGSKSLFGTRTSLYGAPALEATYRKIERLVNGPEVSTLLMPMLLPLKNYKWMLTVDEVAELNK